MRPNIYKFGELIEDVTTHPATRRTVESHARAFDAAHDEKYADIFTAKSMTGEKIHRFNSMMLSMEDVIYNSKFKRAMYRFTGTCSGGLCVGWNAQNVMWNVTYDMDKEFGTKYNERLKKWIFEAQERRPCCSGRPNGRQGRPEPKAVAATQPRF